MSRIVAPDTPTRGSALAIRRDGALIRVTLRGRIETAAFPGVPRLSAPGTIVGDGVDVDLNLTAPEAQRAGEALLELAAQARRHERHLVGTPPP
jgi:hypothetical protein